MTLGKKLLWGGLGWVLGGPIGGIIGYALASMSDSGQARLGYGGYMSGSPDQSMPRTQAGDFIVSVLVLFAKVMKADNRLLRSELDYVKSFLKRQIPPAAAQQYMLLLKDILKQNYPLRDVCRQIQRSMDHPSRLELLHVLFGLSQADGHVDATEVDVIHKIAGYLNINDNDFNSIKAMFYKDTHSAYQILGIDPSATDAEIKKAYRRMANKYHPDKVTHLGDELRISAENKFKAVNDAYQSIKHERGII